MGRDFVTNVRRQNLVQGQPCTCGGRNDNCRFCFGSGVRPVGPGQVQPYRASRRDISKPNYAMAECPICLRLVLNLNGHTKAVHASRLKANISPQNETKKTQLSPLLPTSEQCGATTVKLSNTAPQLAISRVLSRARLSSCSICGCSVRADHVESHIERIHKKLVPPVLRAKSRTIVVSPSKTTQHLVTCPHCPLRSTAMVIRHHLTYFHPELKRERITLDPHSMAQRSKSSQGKVEERLALCGFCRKQIKTSKIAAHEKKHLAKKSPARSKSNRVVGDFGWKMRKRKSHLGRDPARPWVQGGLPSLGKRR